MGMPTNRCSKMHLPTYLMGHSVLVHSTRRCELLFNNLRYTFWDQISHSLTESLASFCSHGTSSLSWSLPALLAAGSFAAMLSLEASLHDLRLIFIDAVSSVVTLPLQSEEPESPPPLGRRQNA